jgi:hypothetical protein
MTHQGAAKLATSTPLVDQFLKLAWPSDAPWLHGLGAPTSQRVKMPAPARKAARGSCRPAKLSGGIGGATDLLSPRGGTHVGKADWSGTYTLVPPFQPPTGTPPFPLCAKHLKANSGCPVCAGAQSAADAAGEPKFPLKVFRRVSVTIMVANGAPRSLSFGSGEAEVTPIVTVATGGSSGDSGGGAGGGSQRAMRVRVVALALDGRGISWLAGRELVPLCRDARADNKTLELAICADARWHRLTSVVDVVTTVISSKEDYLGRVRRGELSQGAVKFVRSIVVRLSDGGVDSGSSGGGAGGADRGSGPASLNGAAFADGGGEGDGCASRRGGDGGESVTSGGSMMTGNSGLSINGGVVTRGRQRYMVHPNADLDAYLSSLDSVDNGVGAAAVVKGATGGKRARMSSPQRRTDPAQVCAG